MSAADLAAMRVANRYAAMVAKAETLLDRAGACRDAAERYRRDARSNQESVENHKMAARTIRDPGIAAEHARQAGEAEAEAAREILAARYYEEQAEAYESQARAASGTAAGGGLTSTEVSMGSTLTTTAAGVVDVLGHADGDTCLGTDRIASVAGPATTLALMDHGDGDDRWDGGRYVAVATSPAEWHPVTGREQPASGEQLALYAPPHLGPAEADAAADHLEELADLADAGHQPPTSTKWSRAARRLSHLMDGDADLAVAKVTIGDDELPVTVRDLLTLLREQDPAGTAASTRRHVVADAIGQAGGDTGTLWMDLVVGHDGATRVAVTGVEGTEDPDDDYWRPYTAEHSPEQARALAASLRTFAVAARPGVSGALYLGGGDDAAYLDWSIQTANGGRQMELGDGYDAISLNLTAGQLRDLRDALTSTIDDVAGAPGAYWPDANDTRYIDWSNADPERGIQLEIGDGTTAMAVTLTPDQLRAWRDRLAIDLADDGQ